MSLADDVETLRRIPLFADIETAKLKLLAFTSERVRYAPGDTLFRQDEPADAAYVILGGEAEVTVQSPTGPVPVARVGQNGIVGEIGILCDLPRTATVRAVTEVRTLRIDRDLFFRLIGEFPQLAIGIMRELARRLEKTTRDLGAARSAGRD